MRHFILTMTCGALIVISMASGPAIAKPRVEFSNNRLKVDGKPFFMYGCWQVPYHDYAQYKQHHFNTVFQSWKNVLTQGPLAAQEGLLVTPFYALTYSPWDEPRVASVKALAKKDWVLGWMLGDDLQQKKHIERVLQATEDIRRIDPQNRPTMLDALGRHRDFAKLADMWNAYVYPLGLDVPRPMIVGPKPFVRNQGMTPYENWLTMQRKLGKPDGFFWTWTQCHVKNLYRFKYLGATRQDPWRPSLFPDGDHLRLVAAHAISAGVRGMMWFMAPYFQDDHHGRDRYARAAIIGCELDIVGPLIAQAKWGGRLKTSDPTVQATALDFPEGRLICLIKKEANNQYQPSGAKAKKVHIEVGASGKVYQIGSRFEKLNNATCSFDLTSWILVTQNDTLAQSLKKQHHAILPEMAAFSIEELDARLTKVKPVFEKLHRGSEALAEANKLLLNARQALKNKQWAQSCHLANTGLRAIRAAQWLAWKDTFISETDTEITLNRVDFYQLPRVMPEKKLYANHIFDSNQLTNGDFESNGGWGKQALPVGHSIQGVSAIQPNIGRAHSTGLQLVSNSQTHYHGEPVDWVTSDLVSEKIPASVGQIWELAAWVNIPQTIQNTNRGASIMLNVYDNNDKPIKGYGFFLETNQRQATNGWKQLRTLVSLRSKQIKSIRVRLAICGIGKAYFDDVTLKQMKPKPHPLHESP